jgi:hypothetical protein
MITTIRDNEYLGLCKKLIIEKLGWRPAAEWRNYEFEELSDKIFEATDVQLSSTTLKRIFGKVKYNNLPSSATLNALAGFLGYANWMELKSTLTLPNAEQSKQIDTPVRQLFINRKRAAVAAIFTGVLIIGFGFIVLSLKTFSKNIDRSAVVFKSRSLASGLPNSVVFNVDLPGVQSDNIIIQQSWDSTKTIPLKPGQKEATGIYYLPGYFRAKLIVDGKIIKEHDLFIPSNQWIATLDHEPIPTYLKKNELVLDKGMTISPVVLNEIRESEKPLTLTYHMVKKIENLHSDNFLFKTKIKSIFHEGPAVCQTAKIFILATNGAYIIPFTIPGCISDINLMLGDKYLPGKSNDLSSFSADLTNWNDVRLEIKNRHVKIFLNDKLIREENYDTNAGEIVGLRFSFLGAGSIDHFSFWNEKKELVYGENFR